MSTLPFSLFPPTPPDFPTRPVPAPQSTSFIIPPPSTHPTDIWRKPAFNSTPAVNSFNAPIIYKSVPFGKFKRVRVTASGEFRRLYDQAGLVIVFNTAQEPRDRKWIKTGLEIEDGKKWISTVSCDRFSDWSLTPLPSSSPLPSTSSSSPSTDATTTKFTIEIERNPSPGGSIWIYIIGENGERTPVREVTWTLELEKGEETEVWVGVYACTPTVEGRGEDGGLRVQFEGWELDVEA